MVLYRPCGRFLLFTNTAWFNNPILCFSILSSSVSRSDVLHFCSQRQLLKWQRSRFGRWGAFLAEPKGRAAFAQDGCERNLTCITRLIAPAACDLFHPLIEYHFIKHLSDSGGECFHTPEALWWDGLLQNSANNVSCVRAPPAWIQEWCNNFIPCKGQMDLVCENPAGLTGWRRVCASERNIFSTVFKYETASVSNVGTFFISEMKDGPRGLRGFLWVALTIQADICIQMGSFQVFSCFWGYWKCDPNHIMVVGFEDWED